ncbi:MAG: hypothetical protein ACYCW6_02380, partial [Candidatus Xenobia bacterium]
MIASLGQAPSPEAPPAAPGGFGAYGPESGAEKPPGVARRSGLPVPAPPSSPPGPTAPQPPIDFSTIDTPQKAALLPSLNATIGASLVQGMVRGMLGGETFSAALDLAFGNSTTGAVRFSMPDDNSLAGTLSGTLGSAAIQESWSVDAVAQTVTVQGTVGSSAEKLQWSRDDDSGWHMSGAVGSVKVDANCTVTDGNHGVLDG